MLKAASPV